MSLSRTSRPRSSNFQAIHVASMLGLAAVSRRVRCDALASAAASSALVVWAEVERRRR